MAEELAYRASDLNGKGCVVNVDDRGITTFVRFLR